MENHRSESHLVVLSTCPDSTSAQNIAQGLIAEKLAACVNITSDLQSIFSWQGQVDSAHESMLIIKTMAKHYAAVERYIKNTHPYQLPEIIAIPIHTGSAEYLNWITTNTQ